MIDMYARKKRMMKFSIVLLILVISISLFSSYVIGADSVEKVRAHGTETVKSTFFQGETIQIKNEGTINIFDQLLKFTITKNNTKIYVRDMNAEYNDYISIDVKDCDLIGYTRICFDSSSGSTLNARIYTLVPDMEIKQYIEKAETSVGEENTMRIEIYNDGMLDCVGCHYEEILHPSMEIVEITGAEIHDGNTIHWNDTIEGKATKTIEYTYRALDAFGYNTTANLTYNNYINIIELTAKADLIANTFLELKTLVAPEKVYLGQKAILAWNLTNVDDEDEDNATISEFYISIPDGIKVTGLPMRVLGYDLEKEQYLWAGRLEYNETKEFWIEFIPENTGLIEIPLYARYTKGDDEESLILSKDIELDIRHRDLDMVTYFNESIPFISSTKYPLTFSLRNIDPAVDYSEVKVKIKSDFFEQNVDAGLLEHNTAKNLNFTLETEPVVAEKETKVEFIVSYLTSYGDKVNSTFTRNIILQPFEEILIEHELSETKNITAGDVIDIKVFVQSRTPYEITNLTLEELLPENFFVQGGDTGKLDKLNGFSREEILSYRVNIPDLNKNTSVNMSILSSLDYKIEEVKKSISNSTTIVINPGKKSLFDSLVQQATVTGSVVRNFSSWPIIGLFLVSLLLLGGSVVTVYSYRREFGIPGIDAIKTKEKWIDKKRKNIDKQEAGIKREQAKIDTKILILKNFLDKTQQEMKKKIPVGEEKKNQLERRKDELMRQKKEIDLKIKELQDEEDKLMEHFNTLEAERASIESEENNLADKHEKMKKRLVELKMDFEKLINKEGNLESMKNKLTSEEIRLMKDKERLLDSGSVKIVSEKENIINEKVHLEHERNKIEEEITSLRSRKENIINEQEAIAKQKVELKNNLNVFDGDKGTINKSLDFLQAENAKLKSILDEMHGVKPEDKPSSEIKETSEQNESNQKIEDKKTEIKKEDK
jgi:hypothetical protein